MTTWKRITSETAYMKVVRRINELMDVERTDAVLNELSLLAFLMEEYEIIAHPIPDVSPAEVILYMMDTKGLKHQDLIPILGTKGNVSKILSGKANLHLKDIHPISTLLGIPVEALIPKTVNSKQDLYAASAHAEEGRLYAREEDVHYRPKEKTSTTIKRKPKPGQ